MEIKEEKTVDMLTTESVSILTQQFIQLDGEKIQVGENHRCAYFNSQSGRRQLENAEPDSVVTAVFAIWGDAPMVPDPMPADPERDDE